ncbi:MAG: VWA domain-containing protein [Acidobacteria bacterium]|nr:VWA domain-containing protein [Acidobacteriota bacterium]
MRTSIREIRTRGSKRKCGLKANLRPGDRTSLICFANNVRLVAPWTADRNLVMNNLKAYQKRDSGVAGFPIVGPPEQRISGTAFYDAIYHAAEELLPQIETGRRALIVFSDGEDNSSAHHLLDAIEAAQRAGALIFSLRYTELKNNKWNARNKYGRAVVERLARETGGADFDAAEGDNLRDAFREIGDVLRSSYDLAYSSSNIERDGGFRKVQIRRKGGFGKIRHKTGYFAR